jgi:large subunit ribosomal protein L37Ae
LVSRSKHKISRLKGLGVKYGATVRKRYGMIYKLLKKKRRCPKCGSVKFDRKALGIWYCSKCTYKVAAGTYDVNFEKTKSKY